MAEQGPDHRLFAMGDRSGHEGDLDESQLDQAELADLGEGPIAARPGEGRPKAAALASESGTSRTVPSIPIRRRPREKAPGVWAGPAGGRRARRGAASGRCPGGAGLRRGWSDPGSPCRRGGGGHA